MRMRVKVIYAHPSRVAFYNNACLREHRDECDVFGNFSGKVDVRKVNI